MWLAILLIAVTTFVPNMAMVGLCLILSVPSAGAAEPLANTELSYRGIQARLAKGEIRTPDDLVSLLPRSMLERYALAFESRSPHSRFVSAEAPRLLTVSDDGLFALGITTVPDENGKVYAEFRDVDTATWNLAPHTIEFDMVGGRAPVLIEDPNRHYADDRRRACVSCHGDKNEPLNLDHHDIWDGYKMWPGFFGPLHHEDDYADEKRLASGRIKFQTAPVYRHLVGIKEISSRQLAISNSEMTEIFSKVNGRRIAARLHQSSNYSAHRAAFLAAVLDYDFKDHLTPEQQVAYLENSGANGQLRSYIGNQMYRYYTQTQDKLVRLGMVTLRDKHNVYNYNLKDLRKWVNLKFLCDQWGISTGGWWMTVERDTFAASTPTYGTPWEISLGLVDDLRITDSDLLPKESPKWGEYGPGKDWREALAKLRARLEQENQSSKSKCEKHLSVHRARTSEETS